MINFAKFLTKQALQNVDPDLDLMLLLKAFLEKKVILKRKKN